MKKMILASAIFLAAFSSCKKDSEPTCDLNATSLQGTYKLTSVKYKESSAAAEVEVFTNPTWFDACERDDTYTFATGNVFTYTDAGTSCGGSATTTGTWSLSGSVLTLGTGGFSSSATITSFSCTAVAVKATNVDVAGDEATYYYTRQ